jgi:NAD(P)-dependent dehydrogenase (short-subunit alcohol dehydrogenase family)
VPSAALDGLQLRTLVLNAGITADALLAKMDEEAFLRVLRVNAGAAWELADLLIPRITAGGAVVAMASRSYLGNVGQFNYAVSKGALVGMVRALALQLAPGIRVNAVAPGLVGTEMTLAMPDDVRERLVERIPAGRMGRPDEIAEVVAQLAGDGFGYVTGQVVVACGGRSL